MHYLAGVRVALERGSSLASSAAIVRTPVRKASGASRGEATRMQVWYGGRAGHLRGTLHSFGGHPEPYEQAGNLEVPA
jgi:hypothetical protein